MRPTYIYSGAKRLRFSWDVKSCTTPVRHVSSIKYFGLLLRIDKRKMKNKLLFLGGN
jgi:hypothetical protein